MKKAVFGIGIVSLCLLVACATTRVWTSQPTVKTIQNTFFQAELEPQLKTGEHFFTAFRFTFRNNSTQELTVDWQASRYLHNGRSSGLFMFEGVTKETARTPPPDTVTAGQTLSKEIWPVNLIGYEKLLTSNTQPGQGGFNRGIIPEGENGMLLVVRRGGKEIQEKITLTIRFSETRP
jgi:hypothetical protein